VAAVVLGLVALDADAVLLTGMDFDLGGAALAELQAQLAAAGAAYPWRIAFRPNTGVATGLDLDGDGRRGGARDAQGWGRFAGSGGMAVLSRLPIAADQARDLSGFLWADLPGALLPDAMDGAARRVQRLATSGFWDVPLSLPGGGRLHLLAWHATPPVFDGPEDRNGRRNHDEAAFWLRLLSGELPMFPPQAPFVLLGDANLDPVDGDGRPDALAALLTFGGLQDPQPRGTINRSDPRHKGDPALEYLLVDMPPGTGDIALTLSQRVPLTGAVIVTTPQDIALIDAKKGLTMFEKVGVPILGIVENMAVYCCPNCGHTEHIFGADGGKRMAEEYSVDYLGALPLNLSIREQADSGRPTVVADPDGEIAAIYKAVARQVAVKIAAKAKDYSAKFPSISISKGT
jgi:predicted RNA-binding Zn-ribbon protein involved in translation (DUF1610 family)